MLNEYPIFARGKSQEEFNKLPKKDKEIITEFKKYCSITASKEKVEDFGRDVLKLRMILGSFDNLDLKALRHYLYVLEKSKLLTETKNGIKIYAQKFLRWHYKDWSERFDEFKDIKTVNGLNEEKINDKTLLTKEEIERIVKKENNLFWKAYFLTQYEGGLRTKEARTIKWDDIKFNVDGDISEISIYATKTKKSRVIYVKEATFFLRRLREETERKSPFVFPSTEDINKPVSKFAVSRWFQTHVSKVVGRKVWAYVLRHTRARELYVTYGGKIPEITSKKFMGHKKSMVDVYSHISNKDVKEAMSKIVYQLEELPPERKSDLEKRVDQLEKVLAVIYKDKRFKDVKIKDVMKR